jgi:prepilin-type processing-associated H-X9-DG protein
MTTLNRHKGAGFALAELLAVTGLLTGLGSAAFTGVKDKANQVACANNLKQIYTSIQLMTAAGEPLPKAWFYPPANPPVPDQRNIASILRVYGCPASVFICPAAPAAIQQRQFCYVYNDALDGKEIDAVANPSTTWLMMDINAVSTKVPQAHMGGCNVLYVDGHVKLMPAAQLPKLVASDAPGTVVVEPTSETH